MKRSAYINAKILLIMIHKKKKKREREPFIQYFEQKQAKNKMWNLLSAQSRDEWKSWVSSVL